MTNKFKYFIGNWKMFGDFGSFRIVNKINKFSISYKKQNKIKIILCVPNTLIHFFKNKLKRKSIDLGVQNCHHKDGYGPYTGAISASMLKKAGAEFIILGHSENRLEGETNKTINKKIISSLNQKLKIVFCIGETRKEKISKKTLFVLRNQIRQSLNKKIDFNNIIFAYEPVWAIGTNKIPKKNDLTKIITFIRNEIKNYFKEKKNPIILYGGSINPNNIHLFSAIPEIDGFLIGGASQSPKKFIDIIRKYYK